MLIRDPNVRPKASELLKIKYVAEFVSKFEVSNKSLSGEQIEIPLNLQDANIS